MSILSDNKTQDAPKNWVANLISKNQILPNIKYLIVSLVVFTTLTTPALASFNDVPDTHNNYSAIDYLSSHAVINGLGNTAFRPNQNVTRAELVKMLVTLNYSEEEIESCNKVNFDDVDKSNPFLNYICIVQKENIVSGFKDNTFRPNDMVNLEASAKMILKTLEKQNDDDKYLLRLNHLKAIPTSIKCSEANVTRGEVAEIIYRITNDVKDRDHKEITDLKSCNEIFVSPLKNCDGLYYISRGYSSGHTGVDFPLKMSEVNKRCEINSIGYGTVEKAQNCRSLGYCVVVKHNNGMRSLYAHLTPELLVKEGQKVEPGDKLGVMGHTGVAHGTHLHFSISLGDKDVIRYRNRVNPSGVVPF